MDHAGLRDVLVRLGVDPDSAKDLGGTMSLNIAVPDAAGVLRVHPPFESRSRIRQLRVLRAGLADAGLTVGTPLLLEGRDLVEVGPWLVELEAFVEHEKPPPTWSSYVWMYRAMGRLHRVLAHTQVHLPRPVVATYGPPSSLRRWLAKTEDAVTDDDEGREIASWSRRLLRKLDRQWVPPSQLPRRIVHGDIRLGNVAVSSAQQDAYFDFGFAAIRPRIHELAYSLLWIVLRPDDSGLPADFPWDDVDELVDAYEHGAGDALSDEERAALGPYLAAVPIYFAAVAAFTPDPAGTLRGEIPSLRIAEWVLDR